MNKFKITLEGTGHRPQVLTENDENIRVIIDAWLYMFEKSEASQQDRPIVLNAGEILTICPNCNIMFSVIRTAK